MLVYFASMSSSDSLYHEEENIQKYNMTLDSVSCTFFLFDSAKDFKLTIYINFL